jgi:hypothetical protein
VVLSVPVPDGEFDGLAPALSDAVGVSVDDAVTVLESDDVVEGVGDGVGVGLGAEGMKEYG